MINIKYDDKNKKVKMEIDLEKIGDFFSKTEKVVKENLNEIPENIEKVFSEILNKIDNVLEETSQSSVEKENKKVQEIVLFENNLLKIIKKENEKDVVLWCYFSNKIPLTILKNAKVKIIKEDNSNILKSIIVENSNIAGFALAFEIDSEDISQDKLLANSLEIRYKPKKHAYRIFIKKLKT